ncbi:MAG: hypothetical protein LBV23_09560 [Deltaproteobacteria bacterium]|jgi:hypothetical protein|nr:hypothetical protein [Deltaproteobacteria bacterium]
MNISLSHSHYLPPKGAKNLEHLTGSLIDEDGPPKILLKRCYDRFNLKKTTDSTKVSLRAVVLKMCPLTINSAENLNLLEPLKIKSDRPITSSLLESIALYNSAKEQIKRRPLANLVLVPFSDGQIALIASPEGTGRVEIAEKVRYGHELIRQILAEHKIGSPNNEDLAAIAWCLQALGSKKSFKSSGEDSLKSQAAIFNGLIVLEDSKDRFWDYLNSAQSYERNSVYFPNFQEKDRKLRARGLDLSIENETPGQSRALLFQKIPPEEVQERHLILISLEPFGWRPLTGEKPTDLTRFGLAFHRYFSNINRHLGHIFSGKANDWGPIKIADNNLTPTCAFKEKIRKFVFELLRKDEALLNHNANDAIFRNIFKLEATRHHGGLRKVLLNIDDTIMALEEEIRREARGSEAPETRTNLTELLTKALTEAENLIAHSLKQIQDRIDRLKKFKNELLSGPQDHPYLRFHQEVIVCEEEHQTKALISIDLGALGKFLVGAIANEREVEGAEKLLRQLLNDTNKEARERYHRQFKVDVKSRGRLTVRDRTKGDLVKIFDSTDPHYRQDAESLYAHISESLESVGDSEFARAIMCGMHQGSLAELNNLVHREFVIRTGHTAEAVGFRFPSDFELVKNVENNYALIIRGEKSINNPITAVGIEAEGKKAVGYVKGLAVYKLNYSPLANFFDVSLEQMQISFKLEIVEADQVAA